VRFWGQYTQARARKLWGKRAPFITQGYSKDHRPDLKQLLFILTTRDDGGIPVQFRCEHGNTNEARTHESTWTPVWERPNPRQRNGPRDRGGVFRYPLPSAVEVKLLPQDEQLGH
jgi:hypothetical protein